MLSYSVQSTYIITEICLALSSLVMSGPGDVDGGQANRDLQSQPIKNQRHRVCRRILSPETPPRAPNGRLCQSGPRTKPSFAFGKGGGASLLFIFFVFFMAPAAGGLALALGTYLGGQW